LKLAPRNAQAFALKGFLLSAENHIAEAITSFNQSISLDGGFGDAWLGRGLCKIRVGLSLPHRMGEGRGEGFAYSPFRIPHSAIEDLQTAATLEPNRSLLRSYL